MSLASTMSNIGSSITGNVQKAVLIFGTGGSSSTSAAGGTASITKMTAQMLNRNGLTNSNLIDTASARYLEVQYNPASMRISANADVIQMRNLQNTLEDGVVNQSCRAPSVILSVDLIFNAVNVKDSFMADKFRISTNDMIKNIISVAQAQNGGYTVQPQSDGLLAASLLEAERFVTFQWADMSFSGELTDVNVQYGMFSLSGKPVHSVVSLRITQQLTSKAEDTRWNQSKFDECFSGKKNTDIGQAASNLLNVTGL